MILSDFFGSQHMVGQDSKSKEIESNFQIWIGDPKWFEHPFLQKRFGFVIQIVKSLDFATRNRILFFWILSNYGSRQWIKQNFSPIQGGPFDFGDRQLFHPTYFVCTLYRCVPTIHWCPIDTSHIRVAWKKCIDFENVLLLNSLFLMETKKCTK